MKALKFIFLFTLLNLPAFADNGYRLWLKYDLISQTNVLENYRKEINSIFSFNPSETTNIAINELENGFNGLLQKTIKNNLTIVAGSIVLLKEEDQSSYKLKVDVPDHEHGYTIKNAVIDQKPVILISS